MPSNVYDIILFQVLRLLSFKAERLCLADRSIVGYTEFYNHGIAVFIRNKYKHFSLIYQEKRTNFVNRWQMWAVFVEISRMIQVGLSSVVLVP